MFKNINESFEKRFKSMEESEINESLKESLLRLLEAEMSDEDRKDTEILKHIYNKTQERSNSKLTPEEQAVLKKYGLERNSDYKTIKLPNEWGDEAQLFRDSDKEMIRYNNYYGKRQRHTSSGAKDINYADRARKMPDRKYARDIRRNAHGNVWNLDRENTPSSAFKNPIGDEREYKGRFIDQERAQQDSDMNKNVRDMKMFLTTRNSEQKNLDTIDKRYDDKIQAIRDKAEKEIATAQSSRESNRKYSQTAVDRNQERINQLLGKNKKVEESFTVTPNKDHAYDIISELSTDGLVSMCEAFVKWMSDNDVGEFLHQNGYVEYED